MRRRVRGSVPCSVAICLIFCLDVERPGGPRGCLGRCSAMICLAVYLNLEQPDTLTRRRGLREANAAGSRVRESMRVFSRASRGAGASGVVHVQALGRSCVFALSLRWRQPVYG